MMASWPGAISILRTVITAHDRGAGSLAGPGSLGDPRTPANAAGREEAIRSVLLAERHRALVRSKSGQAGTTDGDFGSENEATEVPAVLSRDPDRTPAGAKMTN